MIDYAAFLSHKRTYSDPSGFAVAPEDLHPALFDFQRQLVAWALHQGRAALLVGTGLGKTLQQLVWSDQVVRRTNGNVLVLAPLAVSHQTVSEGEKFGIEVRRSIDGTVQRGITVTNYERLHYFDPEQFVGVVCDESAILKDFDGARRNEITRFMRRLPYRLLCSATPAPNDYTELGTSSEALGYLGHIDMLNRFFVNARQNTSTRSRRDGLWRKESEWRFKGHAEGPFWRWVVSWARAVRTPSDLGYDDGPFQLPELLEREHTVESAAALPGMLFPVVAVTLKDQRAERRATLDERCEKVADLVDHDRPALVWCHLNPEGDLLTRLIPDAIQVSGADADEAKEEKLIAFARGEARVLVTKPQIAAHGLNLQHCAHMTFFPSHCYDETTEVLTRAGWKSFGVVSRTDEIATVNQATLALEWETPTDVIWEPYTGAMLHYQGQRNFDLLVTPNHNLFVQRCPDRYPGGDATWHLRTAQAIADRYRRSEYRMLSVPQSVDGDRPDWIEIPPRGRVNARSRAIDRIAAADFMRLAGWYLSEGHCRPIESAHRGRIVICQTDKNPAHRAEIINLMRRIGLSVNDRTKDITGHSVNLAAYLIDQFGSGAYGKRIPRWVKDLHPDLLAILRDTMLKGDGCHDGGVARFYRTASAALANDFQEISLMTGIRASVRRRVSAGGRYSDNDVYDVSLAWERVRPSIHQAPKMVDYDGMIGCVTVPNHTLIVRRNGIPVVSGNSWEQYFQGVRRCWRFGQANTVTVDIVTTPGERRVIENLQGKAKAAEAMFARLVAVMNDALGIEHQNAYTQTPRLPAWLEQREGVLV